MLKRRQVPPLAELTRQDKALSPDLNSGHKPFKAYEHGFVHIDIKYLPQIPDEAQRQYLHVDINRATHRVYLEVLSSQSAEDTRDFLKRMIDIPLRRC